MRHQLLTHEVEKQIPNIATSTTSKLIKLYKEAETKHGAQHEKENSDLENEAIQLAIMLSLLDKLDAFITKEKNSAYLNKMQVESPKKKWYEKILYYLNILSGTIIAAIQGVLGFYALSTFFTISSPYLITGSVLFGIANMLLYNSWEGKYLQTIFHTSSPGKVEKFLEINKRQFNTVNLIHDKLNTCYALVDARDKLYDEVGDEIKANENLQKDYQKIKNKYSKYEAFTELIDINTYQKANKFQTNYQEPVWKKVSRPVVLASGIMLGIASLYFLLTKFAALFLTAAALASPPVFIGLIVAAVVIGGITTYCLRSHSLFNVLNPQANLYNETVNEASTYTQSHPKKENLSEESQQIINDCLHRAEEKENLSNAIPSISKQNIFQKADDDSKLEAMPSTNSSPTTERLSRNGSAEGAKESSSTLTI